MFSENASSADNQQERFPKSVDSLKYYLSGFTDGEGCFSISVHRSKYRALKWNMNPFFQVYQHKDNDYVLHLFKKVLSCGYVSKKGGNPLCHVYCVDKISDLLDHVIPFFDSYKLLGNKHLDFLLFKEITLAISKKEHLTKRGFVRLTKLAFKMNGEGKHRKTKIEEIINSLGKSSEAKR